MKDVTKRSMKELVEVYNQKAEKPIKKFRSLAEGVKRVRKLLEGSTQKAPAKKAPGKRGARTKYDSSMKITKVQSNPKREGSAAHKRYNLYKVGMTIADALKAGVITADINWDVKQGFIEVK